MSAAVILGLVAAVSTYGGVKRFRRWAERRQILDLPNARSSHTRPTPRGGGVIIVAVTLVGGAFLVAALAPAYPWPAYLPYAAGALLVAGVSWIDDLRSLPNSLRFAVHLLATLVAIAGLGYWHVIDLPLYGPLALGWWGAVLTAVWIVGLTNAYNFMDGTDGIAGGLALAAGLGWAFLGWEAGDLLVGGLGLLIACSCLGFLVHNWPPARIFMGDVGSAFLGYTLAVLPVMFAGIGSESGAAPVVGCALVWPFVFDTAFTFTRRLLRRENVFSAHRSHLYQRLIAAGSSHRRVALIYVSLALVGCILAQRQTRWTGHGVGFIGLPLLSLCLWAFVVLQERRVVHTSSNLSSLADV
ncbi:MAG: glycosyltransferase family 4 protein [Acidobacteriia bacterium]|nr:glycosyltransferase family 4 protein [Terriglobia bacterium]